MSEDPLSTYQSYVQIAEEDVEDGDAPPWERVVATLAAEVRAQRDTIRELQKRVAELEKELALADADVAAKRNYIDDLEREMACARKLDMDQLDQIKALREERDEIKRKAIEQSEYIQSHGLTEYEMERLKARVAELETEAEIGGLLDRIPPGGCLRRSKIYRYPHWRVEPFNCHDLTGIGWSRTPMAALGVERKEEG